MAHNDARMSVGIDVAATTLAVVVLSADAPPTPATTVANSPAGWRALQALVRQQGGQPTTTLLVLEATGAYWQGAATALVAAGWTVSVLAQYGRDLHPAPWTPPTAAVQALQLLVRQRDDLVAMRTQTRNRQHALAQLPAVPPEVLAPVTAVLTVLREQIAAVEAAIRQRATAAAALADASARLTSIPGVGLLTAVVVLTETAALRHQATAPQVVAYAGLDPAPRQSGTSVRGQPRISKTGNARLRQALHMAAVSAARCNPHFQRVYRRLLAHGKAKPCALTAVARKLLVVMCALLTHHRTFDPDWAAHHPPRRP